MATFEILYEPKHAARSPHLVFVHGLGGHIRETWMRNPKDESTLWPNWIGQELQCPVWLLGYDAALSGWTAGAMPLTAQGTAVLDRLAGEPRFQAAPFVVIGHSLGGLVIKSALLNAKTLGVQRYDFFPRHLRGVVFIATPHFGSQLATLIDALRVPFRRNPQVGDLRMHDPHLSTLNTQFRALHKELGFSVRSFSETDGVATPIWLGIRGPSVRVVSSGDPHVDGDTAIPLPEDHFTICKPATREAQIHKSVVEFIVQVTREDNSPFHTGSNRLPSEPEFLDTGESLISTVGSCEIQIRAGRMEDQSVAANTVAVLPCNEYFDDNCAADSRSALGSWVAKRLGGRSQEFMADVKRECLSRFGHGNPTAKTESESGMSFGIGRCLLLQSPLGSPIPIALLSTTTQRAGVGLAAQVSYLFPAIEDLVRRMADARLNNAIIPVLGAGHGGIEPAEALCGLLLAISQEARRPRNPLRQVTIVVFRRDARSPIEIQPVRIKQALSIVGSIGRH
ncbi:MAG: hypothetical protein JWM41_383 [Gemmatimonadetes bacterium]|nr:hypothetical protein [Gemmatimonadota bacterium]